jgi:hypothetical protein
VAPNHKLIRVAVVSAADSGSGLASFDVTCRSSGRLGHKKRDTVTLGDGLQPRVVKLRAEHLASGKRRTYWPTATATDKDGNTTSVTTTVIVPGECCLGQVGHSGTFDFARLDIEKLC